jgi:signal transduction histidine kinase
MDTLDETGRFSLKPVVDELPMGLVVVDTSGRVIYTNSRVDRTWRQQAIRRLDVSEPAEWRGFHADGRPYLPEEWPVVRSLTKGEVVDSEEIRIVRGDGTMSYEMVSSTPVRGSSGRIVGAVVTMVDTTHRHLVEERLSILYDITTELQRAQTFEDLAAVFLDRLVEPLGAEVAALARLKSDGSSLEILGSSGLDPELRNLYASFELRTPLPPFHALQSGEPLWLENRDEASSRFPLLRELGDSVRSRAMVCIPLTVDGETIGVYFLGFLRDRSFSAAERRFHMVVGGQCAIALQRAMLFEREAVARREAERALSARDEFLAIVSHEVRTPLTTILGWADMLLLNQADAEMLRVGLESIRSSALVQRRIIDDLLDATRMLAGSLRLEMKEFDGRTIVERVVTSFHPDAARRGVNLEIEVPAAEISIRGDSARVAQVLSNLVSNAMKFTPPGGTIRVCAAPVNDCIEVTVSDTGAGIDPEILPMIFDRFVRGSRSREGLGLGLTIAQHIAVRHGGDLRAHSDGEGRGSTFTLRLPCHETSAS